MHNKNVFQLMKGISVTSLFALTLLLIGCMSGTKTVYLPVTAKCPAPIIPSSPDYPRLSSTATPPEFVKWCVVSNKMCRDDNEELRILLNGYKS